MGIRCDPLTVRSVARNAAAGLGLAHLDISGRLCVAAQCENYCDL